MGFIERLLGYNEKDNSQRKLLEFDDKLKELISELNQMKKDLKSVEICALEAKEKYAKKLKKLIPIEEEADVQGNNAKSQTATEENGVHYY